MNIDAYTKGVVGLWLALLPTAINFWWASTCIPPRFASGLVFIFATFAALLALVTFVNVFVRAQSLEHSPGALAVSYFIVLFAGATVNYAVWHLRGAPEPRCSEAPSRESPSRFEASRAIVMFPGRRCGPSLYLAAPRTR